MLVSWHCLARWPLVVGLIALLVTSAVPVRAQENAVPRILVVHSYEPRYTWEQELNRGITEGLAAAGFSEAEGTVEIHHFWMDTIRRRTPEALGAATAEVQQTIRDLQPDVVMLADNPAIRMVVDGWTDTELPIVFLGLNSKPSTYGLTDMPQVTGVLEAAHIRETLAWIKHIMPDAARLTLLSDDSLTTSAFAREAQFQLDGSADFHGSRMVSAGTFVEWQQAVIDANEQSDILLVGLYHSLEDLNGQPMDPAAVMTWTTALSQIPVVALWEMGVADGALGGSTISGEAQGYEAALRAAQILQGAAPSSIPYLTPRHGKLTLNAGAIRQWDIQIPLDLLEISTLYGIDGTVVNR